jgi:Trp operon repressor
MHNNKNKLEIEERRRKVSSLLDQSMTEKEIAGELGVDQSIISRYIKALKSYRSNLSLIWQSQIKLTTISNVLME